MAGVGEIMMFLGKLAIAALTTGAFYLLILYNPSSRINVLQPIYLLIIVFIMSYAVGMLFMSVYSLAMDTLLACFVVDETNQKAKGGKSPQYAPPELAALMDTEWFIEPLFYLYFIFKLGDIILGLCKTLSIFTLS